MLAINTFKEKALKIPEKEINPSFFRIRLKIITLTIAEIELAIAKTQVCSSKIYLSISLTMLSTWEF